MMNGLLLLTFLLLQGTTPPQAGVVTGRVLNSDGSPAAGIRVSLMRAPEAPTQARPDPVVFNLTETSSTGIFRMDNVPSGRYYVVAGFLEQPTYYPGTRQLTKATAVNVTASSTVSGIEFRVDRGSGGFKVGGRIAGLDASALAAEGLTVSLKTTSYLEVLRTTVHSDGTYEFSPVRPGNYMLTLAGATVPQDACALINVSNTDLTNATIRVPSPGLRNDDIQIISANFGAGSGSADVTPMVRKWVKPELVEELYSAPKWLEVDPAIGQTKSLVVSYLYRCREHVITTTEPNPISYAILTRYANSGLAKTGSTNNEVRILAAHWGLGNQFRDVTARVSELFKAGEFTIDDAILGAPASTGNKVLILTYNYGGDRNTSVLWRDTQLNEKQLIALAQKSQSNTELPGWFSDADPFLPREPGDAGPGFGQQSRRELGIAQLLKAVAELKAMEPADVNREIQTITALAQQALNDAQVSMNYAYPRPASSPIAGPARVATASERVMNATRALKAALEQFKAATGPK